MTLVNRLITKPKQRTGSHRHSSLFSCFGNLNKFFGNSFFCIRLSFGQFFLLLPFCKQHFFYHRHKYLLLEMFPKQVSERKAIVWKLRISLPSKRLKHGKGCVCGDLFFISQKYNNTPLECLHKHLRGQFFLWWRESF